MTVPNNTNLTATTAQVMPSPMDDLPVVIPSYAGQHPAGTVIVGAEIVTTATTQTTHTHRSTDSPNAGDPLSTLGSSSPRPSTTTRSSTNGIRDGNSTLNNQINTHNNQNAYPVRDGGAQVQQGDEPGPSRTSTAAGTNGEVGGERTGEREKEADEGGMEMGTEVGGAEGGAGAGGAGVGGETELERTARIELERALRDLKREMGGVDEEDLRRY